MLLLFLLVSLISFVGSLHPGPVNLAVAQVTLTQSRRAGLWLALGGSLPELVYSALAVRGVSLLNNRADWLVILQGLSVPVLLVAGVVTLRQRRVAGNAAETHIIGPSFPFWRGLGLAATNPQLIPFWSAVWLSLQGSMLLATNRPQSLWVFAAATTAGAFMLLAGVVWLANQQRHRLAPYLSSPWLNRLTGSFFICLALWQLALQFWS